MVNLRTYRNPMILTLSILAPAALSGQGVTQRILNNNSSAAWTLSLTGSPTGSLEVERASGKAVGKLKKAGDSISLIKKEDFKLSFTSQNGQVSMNLVLKDKNGGKVAFSPTIKSKQFSFGGTTTKNGANKVAVGFTDSRGIEILTDTID